MKYRILFIILTLLLACNTIFWASQKEGFHVDELFSYEQVGNTKYPKPEYDRPDEPVLNMWHTRDYYEDYLTVSSEEAFDISAFYSSASRNTAHPPLYLTLLGMFISAVTPGFFTKWSGITFNLIFYLATIFVFFDISKRILKKDILALYSLFLFGISVGTVSSVIFIRDYMMFIFFSVTLLDVHMLMLGRKLDTSKPLLNRLLVYFAFMLSLILGSLTHYYFIVFSIFVCVGYILILLLGREYRLFIEYIVANIMGVIIYFLIWPNIFRDFISEQRGTEAIRNLAGSSAEYSIHLAHYLHSINLVLTGGVGNVLILIALLLLLCRVAKMYSPEFTILSNGTFIWKLNTNRKHRNDGVTGMEWMMFLLVLFSSIGYLLLITKIAPVLWLDTYKDIRYVYNLFPCLILLMLFTFDKLFLGLFNTKCSKAIAWSVLTIVVLLSYLSSGIGYLYKGADAQLALLDDFSKDRAIFVSEMNYFSSNLNVYFTKTEAVYQTRFDDICKIPEALKDSHEKQFLLYVSTDTEDPMEVVERVIQELNAKGVKYLFETVGRHTALVYLISL